MKKLKISYIKKSFDDCGYKLLTKKYINSRQKLEYICPNGHRHFIRWNNWQQCQRCPYCAGVAKPDIKFIKKSFKLDGYKLLTTEYINAHTYLDYICPNGHRHSIKWNDWQQGYRCPYCANNKQVGEGNPFYGKKHTEETKRKMSENHIDVIGDNNPNWKGGITCEPYCDAWADKEYKESIKERDGYQCQNPDCWETSKRLTIHHIDYVKKNCRPENLITICNSCNSRANHDREWHTSWYQILMTKKYGCSYE